jgi:hypothetical protein
MRKSTKHAIAQRILALFGVTLFAGPMWFHGLQWIPPALQLLGLPIVFFATISVFGFGPWGRYYNEIIVTDNETYLKSLEPKQPWQ